MVVTEYGADPGDFSLLSWDEDDAFGGGDALFLDGYDHLPSAIAEELDVRLEHVVRSVSIKGDEVYITTNQGEFRSSYAVITLPLGVLKAGDVTFSPPLPKAKRAAIDRMKMGLLEKLWMKFPKTFWPTKTFWLERATDRREPWCEFVNAADIFGAPVLLAFNGGQFARDMADQTDEQLTASAMKALRIFAGEATHRSYPATVHGAWLSGLRAAEQIDDL